MLAPTVCLTLAFDVPPELQIDQVAEGGFLRTRRDAVSITSPVGDVQPRLRIKQSAVGASFLKLSGFLALPQRMAMV